PRLVGKRRQTLVHAVRDLSVLQTCVRRSNSRVSSNKKERVPGGPLSRPFGSTDRYEVSMTDGVNIAFLPAVARVPRGRDAPQADHGRASSAARFPSRLALYVGRGHRAIRRISWIGKWVPASR